MDRAAFTNHKGKRILLIDLTGLQPGDFAPIIAQVEKLVSQEPRSSLLTLTDASKSRFDIPTVQALKNLSANNKPYVKAAAVVGIEGPLGILMDGLEKFSGRVFSRCGTREQAMDWLVQQ